MQDTQVQSLGWEDPLEKDVATHSRILAWEIPWTEEPGGLPSMGSERVRQDRITKHARTLRSVHKRRLSLSPSPPIYLPTCPCLSVSLPPSRHFRQLGEIKQSRQGTQ